MLQHPSPEKTRAVSTLLGLAVFLVSCLPLSGINLGVGANSLPTGTPEAPAPATVTPTPFQPEGYGATETASPPETATPLPSPTITATSAASAPPGLWISSSVPALLHQIASSSGIPLVSGPEAATISLDVAASSPAATTWIYALVAPFPTIIDGVTMNDIRQAWAGGTGGPFGGKPFRMDQATLAAFSAVWGPPAPRTVYVAAPDRLLDLTWTERPIWAIVPFEALEPRWKVLTVDGQSPIHRDFDPSTYPLKVSFSLTPSAFNLPSSNWDPQKLTVLAMTGVTALVRGTADRMEQKGLLYPGQDIRDVLRSADLTHISNEVAFDPSCPTPDPYTASLRFCSSPRYIALLEDVNTKIVELTGNHMMDYGSQAMLQTLDMYTQRGWFYFGGGKNLADAQKPITLVDHGNKLAFVGCNPSGPPSDWATENTPGSAPCNYDRMVSEITRLRSEGFLPIVTFQYEEYYVPVPTLNEQTDFRRMAEAGAVIVSGSQAHVPQTMEFDNGSFIHYGLGNLFFDQMAHLMPDGTTSYDTRREFVDRQVFYDGKYISVELLTYILEDYAKPRPATLAERSDFLATIFKAAGWGPP